MPDPVVALSGVSVVRSRNHLIADIDWTIKPGERWVLFGPNGSGKTTLMQVTSTYLGPTGGTVQVLGGTRRQVDVRELRRRIGYVGSKPTEFVRLEMAALHLVVGGKHASFVDPRWHDHDEADFARAHELLDLLHVDHLSERSYGTLSDGERKRVFIARALMTEPGLLLLDEPGAGLDVGGREQLVAALTNVGVMISSCRQHQMDLCIPH